MSHYCGVILSVHMTCAWGVPATGRYPSGR
jgi:hypothetical protein